MEHQTLGRRVNCPIGPASQRIILLIDGFLATWPSNGKFGEGPLKQMDGIAPNGPDIIYLGLPKTLKMVQIS